MGNEPRQNQLIKVESHSNVPSAQKRAYDFSYDYMGRRILKKEYTWNGSAWALQSERKFIYDGWNVVAELNGSGTVQRTFTWGLDASTTLQGAGGVAGLLMIREGSNQYFPGYDGNGNVSTVVDQNGNTVAAYEYDPFGNLLRMEGSYAESNPFRFSTKWTDETGLVYYGYRYYSADLGRFLNRDPIGEAGGLNLYGFVGNDGVNGIDYLGLTTEEERRPSEMEGCYEIWEVDRETGTEELKDIVCVTPEFVVKRNGLPLHSSFGVPRFLGGDGGGGSFGLPNAGSVAEGIVKEISERDIGSSCDELKRILDGVKNAKPGQKFSDPRAAELAAAYTLYKKAGQVPVEYGAIIYYNPGSGTFSFTSIDTANNASSYWPTRRQISEADGRWVGLVHTHPTSPLLSPPDINVGFFEALNISIVHASGIERFGGRGFSALERGIRTGLASESIPGIQAQLDYFRKTGTNLTKANRLDAFVPKQKALLDNERLFRDCPDLFK